MAFYNLSLTDEDGVLLYTTRVAVESYIDPDDVTNIAKALGSASVIDALKAAIREDSGSRMDECAKAQECVDLEGEPPFCSTCMNGYGIELGTLGTRKHYRCAACGMEFSVHA